MLNNKQTVTAMVDSLGEAALLGVGSSELAQGIQRRLEACREWEKRGEDFFSAPGRAPLSALEVSICSCAIALLIRVFFLPKILLPLSGVQSLYDSPVVVILNMVLKPLWHLTYQKAIP